MGPSASTSLTLCASRPTTRAPTSAQSANQGTFRTPYKPAASFRLLTTVSTLLTTVTSALPVRTPSHKLPISASAQPALCSTVSTWPTTTLLNANSVSPPTFLPSVRKVACSTLFRIASLLMTLTTPYAQFVSQDTCPLSAKIFALRAAYLSASIWTTIQPVVPSAKLVIYSHLIGRNVGKLQFQTAFISITIALIFVKYVKPTWFQHLTKANAKHWFKTVITLMMLRPANALSVLLLSCQILITPAVLTTKSPIAKYLKTIQAYANHAKITFYSTLQEPNVLWRTLNIVFCSMIYQYLSLFIFQTHTLSFYIIYWQPIFCKVIFAKFAKMDISYHRISWNAVKK